jgi:hypothetical protein
MLAFSLMQIEQIVALLVAERDRLNQAIAALNGNSASAASPKEAAATPAARTSQRKTRTPAQRQAHAERMRAFWAERRKQKAK